MNIPSMLKRKRIIIPMILIIAAVSWYTLSSKTQTPQYNSIIAQRQDVVEQVSVTGHVKAVSEVDLGFEIIGKVAHVYADVGKRVKAGEPIVALNAISTHADLSQARAALAAEQAKLDELKRGTRPEELRIARTSVESSDKSLIDARTNLANITTTADIALANLYSSTPDVLNSAYTGADTAVNKYVDELFINASSDNPLLTFVSTNSHAEQSTKSLRVSTGHELAAFRAELDHLTTSPQALEDALGATIKHLFVARDFLASANTALNNAANLSSATLAAYKADVATARASVDDSISVVNKQLQAITAQKATNATNIATAQAKVNDAENALQSAQDELKLKEAGSTPQDIAAQVAQVARAEANVESSTAALAKTVLNAPFDGIITFQDAKVGATVSANVSIVGMISDAKFQIEANIPEADIAKVHIDNLADITLDAYGDKTHFGAHVVAIDPAATVIDGVPTYKVTLEFTQNDERIKSGMTANIVMTTATREHVIAIPQRAIIIEQGAMKVYLIPAAQVDVMPVPQPQAVDVQLGVRDIDGNVEIIAGVSEGDRVITSTINP